MAEENEKPAVEAPKVDEDIEVDLSKPLLR